MVWVYYCINCKKIVGMSKTGKIWIQLTGILGSCCFEDKCMKDAKYKLKIEEKE